jgi:hypothetical protein
MNLNIPENSRAAIAGAIEMLIDRLDALDPDSDLEPNADGEPWLGWPDEHQGKGAVWLDKRAGDDLEIEGDDEPTLGAPERHPYGCGIFGERFGDLRHDGVASQDQWARGKNTDGEAELVNEDGGDILDERHDGDGDEEPWLGSLHCLEQDRWFHGALDGQDLETGDWGDEDREPSLGWTTSGSMGGTDDREEGHDGSEPSLGLTENIDAGHWRTTQRVDGYGVVAFDGEVNEVPS